jgi:hypothetical protein
LSAAHAGGEDAVTRDPVVCAPAAREFSRTGVNSHIERILIIGLFIFLDAVYRDCSGTKFLDLVRYEVGPSERGVTMRSDDDWG